MVQHQHQAAKFAPGIGWRDARGEARRHFRDAADLGPNTEFREQADAREQHDRYDAEHSGILGQAPVRRRHQLRFRTTDHDVQIDTADGERVGNGPNLGFTVGAGQLACSARVIRRKPEQFGFRNGCTAPVGSGLCRRPVQHHPVTIGQHDFHARRHIPDLLLDQPVEVERGQQHELDLAGFVAGRVGNLQHRRPGQPAERRFDHGSAVGLQGLLEIFAVAQIEFAAGQQRIAEQAAVGRDGQDAGVLRVLLANFGQEVRTRRLVASRKVAGARQAEVKLDRSLNLGVEVRCDGAGGRGQAGDRYIDFLAAVLKIPAADQQRRQKYRSQYQQ